jgi:PTS system, fructose subfamily, IIA component
MIIAEHLNPKAISIDLKGKTKKKVLQELTEVLIASGEVEEKEKDNIIKILLEREKIGSTGVGYGVAIPHGKSKAVESATLAFGYSKKGVTFGSVDCKPVHLFFLLLTSPNRGQLHLKVLARMSRFLKDRNFRENLIRAKNANEVYEVIENKEKRDRIQ